MESQPQNPEFRNNPKHFHPCSNPSIPSLMLYQLSHNPPHKDCSISLPYQHKNIHQWGVAYCFFFFAQLLQNKINSVCMDLVILYYHGRTFKISKNLELLKFIFQKLQDDYKNK